MDECYYDGNTALMKVCDRGLLETATLLVDKGADVNRATSDGTTPLYMAIQKGFTPLVRLLMKMGADAKFCRPADGCAGPRRRDGGAQHNPVMECTREAGLLRFSRGPCAP